MKSEDLGWVLKEQNLCSAGRNREWHWGPLRQVTEWVGPRGKNVQSLIREQASWARGAKEDLRGMATLGSPLQCLVRIWFGYLVELLELLNKAITVQSNLLGSNLLGTGIALSLPLLWATWAGATLVQSLNDISCSSMGMERAVIPHESLGAHTHTHPQSHSWEPSSTWASLAVLKL